MKIQGTLTKVPNETSRPDYRYEVFGHVYWIFRYGLGWTVEPYDDSELIPQDRYMSAHRAAFLGPNPVSSRRYKSRKALITALEYAITTSTYVWGE